MNVIKCEECGFEISMKTSTCFNCGEKLTKAGKSRIMGFFRRVAFILFAIYILLTALKIF